MGPDFAALLVLYGGAAGSCAVFAIYVVVVKYFFGVPDLPLYIFFLAGGLFLMYCSMRYVKRFQERYFPSEWLKASEKREEELYGNRWFFGKRKTEITIIDPKKWYFDKESGEYFRIISLRPDGSVLYNKVPWKKRSSYRALLEHNLEQESKKFAVSLVISVIAFFVMYNNISDKTWVVCVISGFAMFVAAMMALIYGGWCLSLMGKLKSPENEVGPRPVAPPGLAEVQGQGIYGRPDWLDLDKAAKGKGQGVVTEPEVDG